MDVLKTDIPGVLRIIPKVFGDARGYFLETYQAQRYFDAGIKASFVQDNLSSSRRGILRGLHLQSPLAQGKLVTVLQGEVFDVAVDIRLGSPSFGKWVGFYLNDKTKEQIYIPPGLAHGFCVTSESAVFSYKCTQIYAPSEEVTLLWNDSDLKIEWPIGNPILSDKDKNGFALKGLNREKLIRYEE